MIKAEITDKKLLSQFNKIEEDKMSIFTMADGRVRGAIFHGTRFVNQLRAQHKLGILETYILGQASLCAALTIPMMKDMEHTAIKFEGQGSAAGFSVEADSTGYVRGYLFNPHIPLDKPLDSWDLGSFLGQGNLTFSRVHKDDKYPQSSTVAVEGHNIAQDFASYFAQSEQINTAFNSSIQFDKEGRVVGAGAFYLQVMPVTGGNGRLGSQVDSHVEESEEDKIMLRKIENAIKACPSLGLLYSENEVDSEDIIVGLFREFKPVITLKRDIKYDCPCNEGQFIDYIKHLPKKQLEEIKNDGQPLQIKCENCGSIYTIPLDKIF